ncbi:hypothetical protein P152DRAFT_465257 [Eremomyces bilateralis CBS 781.70]|uniref:Uncharacterized protein n=1 Tax=Eremomyces bilateralis CBS 781.70 TaxID=1392243 RepID=A0A6G1G8J1_9PEZI|nr:uncharacterized protein P152DRAFT_465257 [Eremomyces bilateralis CBS 781.70]KAF1814388.1 hypothetical protein P152DRAFT_465257 [Eremomyces bilateralis CBS 781.70]
MSRLPSLSNIIHIRDFINTVTNNPTRQGSSNYEDGFYYSDVVVKPIRARIRAYLTQEQRELFIPDAFFYADGRFSTTLSADNTLEINVQALNQWCPMVTIVGSVSSRNNDNSLDPAHARRFVIDTSVYNASNAAPVPYSMACFLEDSKRWAKVKIPQAGTFITLTAKVVGRTTNTNLLALRILDLAYLPKLARHRRLAIYSYFSLYYGTPRRLLEYTGSTIELQQRISATS